MAIDHSEGRYNVFDPNRSELGRIDHDEFIRNGGSLIYRIDGDEIYSMDGKYLGFIEDSFARSPNGQLLFTIEPE